MVPLKPCVLDPAIHRIDDVRDRAAALRALDHPRVIAPVSVELAEHGIVTHAPMLDGDDLDVVAHLHGRLTLGQCVTVGVEVAEALAAMHHAGLAHGDVSPANVVVTGDGAVLIDTVAGASATEHGTPGIAAPDRTDGASAPGDVYALARTLLAVASEEAGEALGPWVASMLAAEPEERPSAAAAATALSRCAPRESVSPSGSDVAQSMRAHARAPRVRTERRPEGRVWRWGRMAVGTAVALVATAAVMVGAGALTKRGVELLAAPPRATYNPSPPLPTWVGVSAEQSARALTEERFIAIADADVDALLSTTVQGSPAHEDALLIAAALGDWAVDGLSVDVASVEVLSETGRRAVAVVAYEVMAHMVTGPNGIAAPVQGYSQTVVLDLTWTEEGWRVERARPRT